MSSISTDVERDEQGERGSETKGEGHYADVNGIKLYYEIHGTGRPLILLHGGLGAIEMFGPNLTILAKRHQVIGVDLQAHGRTADIDRPIRTELMAEDIAALIKHMKLERPDVVGYSLGGGVAFFVALRHPELVRKLVIVSTPIKRNAFYPDILVQQGQVTPAAAEAMKQTPMYQLYASLAPRRPEDWPRLLGKIGDALDLARELVRRPRQRARPHAGERERIERAPMDRYGEPRPDHADRLGGTIRIEMADPQARPPTPDRQKRDVDVARERGHLGEEIGVAGEVHARRAGDPEADRGGGRTERPPSSVVQCRHRFDRQSPDRKPVAGGELFDLVPGRANERA